MMNKQSLLLFYFIYSISGLEKFLQFIPHKDVTIRKSVYELDEDPVSVDAFQSSQVLIKYIQSIRDLNFPEFKFYCHVKELETNFKISNAYLCKKQSIMGHEDCHLISKDTQKIKFQEHMQFETKFDPGTGIIADLNMDISAVKSRLQPFDGFYYCKLENHMGSISSNYIEIQDFEFYKTKLSNFINQISVRFAPSPINDFTSDSFPIYLDCGKLVGNYEENIPKWANKDLLSSFTWQLCPDATSGIQCFSSVVDTQKKSSRPLEEFIDYYQFPNGTAVLLGIKGNDYIKAGLFCGLKAIVPKMYSAYLVKTKNALWRPISYTVVGKYNKKIKQLSAENTEITIREGKYRSSRFKLYALYVGNPDHTKIKAEWKKDTYSLPSTFKQGPYQLVFPIEISESYSGKYDLKIIQSEPFDTVTFRYNVKVVSSPKLKDNIKQQSVFYVTVDKSAQISVFFERDITKLSLEVNNMPIDLLTAKAKEKSVKNLCYKFPFLTGIDISANISLNEGMIYYEAKNLIKRSNSPQAKTHTVTFIAENDIGVSKVSYLIRVFENPTFIYYLNDFNCTDNCMDDQRHDFKCSINETEYKKEGFTIKYVWTINGLSVDNMQSGYAIKSFLEVNNDTITIKPIKSANLEKYKEMLGYFSKSNLSCRVDIVPTSNPSETFYSTDQNPNLRPYLQAMVNLQANSVDTASTSRYLPIVISLIVTVIIVVLILYFCLRGSGETYNVDQKERAHGHDPEKEIRDNEIFQPYERDHETNVVQPSHLSFNDDDSVGVGSDDGELDVYDIDPGKFNEEGSFIGQYASDPRKNKINNS